MRVLSFRNLIGEHPNDMTIYPCKESRLLEIKRYFNNNTCTLENIETFKYLKWLQKEYENNSIEPYRDIFDKTTIRRYKQNS
jgi:predicted secreted protein